jgi:hypothetical protein
MQAIEKQVSGVDRFELFTGSRSEKNLYFYKKLGYSVFRSESMSPRVELVFLEKKYHGS